MRPNNDGCLLHELSFWRTPSGSEVDFVWARGKRAVGLEVKASRMWRREFGSALKHLVADRVITAAHGVYTGDVRLRDGPIHVWPIGEFLQALAAGEVLAGR